MLSSVMYGKLHSENFMCCSAVRSLLYELCMILMCDLVMLLCAKVVMDQIELFTVSVFTCLS